MKEIHRCVESPRQGAVHAPNGGSIKFVLNYLHPVVDARLKIKFGEAENSREPVELPSLGITDDGSAFSEFIAEYQPQIEE